MEASLPTGPHYRTHVGAPTTDTHTDSEGVGTCGTGASPAPVAANEDGSLQKPTICHYALIKERV